MKVKNEQWRAAASLICETLDAKACQDHGEKWRQDSLRVVNYGAVYPCGGGAFVECMLWVADEAVDRNERT